MANKPQSLSKGQGEEVAEIVQAETKRLQAKLWHLFFVLSGSCTILAFIVGGVSLWGIWKSVERKMQAQVARQFEEPQIKSVVQEAATERASVLMAEQIAPEVSKFKADVAGQLKESQALVGRVAQEVGKARAISEEVADRNQRAETKLKLLDSVIGKTTSTLAELERTTEFVMTTVAAQTDDRKAFDRLEVWSKDKTHPFCEKARQAWNTIRDTHSQLLLIDGRVFPWAEGVDPSKLPLSALKSIYQPLPAWLKPALLEYIWKREDIPKIDRLDFLMVVVQQDESLMAVEYAGRCVGYGTGGVKIKSLSVEFLSNWWKEHRNEFVEAKNRAK